MTRLFTRSEVSIKVRDYTFIAETGAAEFNEVINIDSREDLGFMDNQMAYDNNTPPGIVPPGAPNAGRQYVPTVRANISIRGVDGKFISYKNCEPCIRNAVASIQATH